MQVFIRTFETIQLRTLVAGPLMVFLLAVSARSQNEYVWLKLTNGRVVINATIRTSSNDSIVVVRGTKKSSIAFGDIEKLRVIHESSLVTGAIVGAGIGAGIGAAVSTTASRESHSGLGPSNVLLFGFLGGLIGAIGSSFDSPEEVIDLWGKSNAEKKEIIKRFISSNRR